MAQISGMFSKTLEFMEKQLDKRYFIEPISIVPHIKTVLCTRFVQQTPSKGTDHQGVCRI